jgi:hypothetical protein
VIITLYVIAVTIALIVHVLRVRHYANLLAEANRKLEEKADRERWAYVLLTPPYSHNGHRDDYPTVPDWGENSE